MNFLYHSALVTHAHLRSEGGRLVLGPAVALAVQEQVLALWEARQHIDPVQLRQRQRVVAEPQQAQARHACSSMASMAPPLQVCSYTRCGAMAMPMAAM